MQSFIYSNDETRKEYLNNKYDESSQKLKECLNALYDFSEVVVKDRQKSLDNFAEIGAHSEFSSGRKSAYYMFVPATMILGDVVPNSWNKTSDVLKQLNAQLKNNSLTTEQLEKVEDEILSVVAVAGCTGALSLVTMIVSPNTDASIVAVGSSVVCAGIYASLLTSLEYVKKNK